MNEKLKDLSDKELMDELKRREENRKQALIDKQLDYAAAMNKISQETIDVIAPVHRANSCSDDNLRNGWPSLSYRDAPRCLRCALMQRDWDYEYELVCQVRRVIN